MRQVVFIIGVFLLLSGIFAGSAAAQTNSNNLSMFLPATTTSSDSASLVIAPLPFTPALNTSTTAPLPFELAPANTAPLSAFNQPAALPQQDVQGVFQNFNWQAYAGYTFVRFFQVPGIQVNTNGLNFGVVYYFKDWIGADGEFVGTFGSQYGDTAKFLLGMGGGRLRWSAPRGLELWAHALVGGAHYLPRTANGDTGALAYEFGGGVDISAGRRRWAYRLSADVVGTRFFNTYQYSPKFSAGIVFKF
jgi:hypothetical protein